MKKNELVQLFGSYGYSLYNLIRGVDDREVETNKIRKSISVEDTFLKDLNELRTCQEEIKELYRKLLDRCKSSNVDTKEIKEIFLKIKFSDFETITRQKKSFKLGLNSYIELFKSNINKINKPIRLIGIGFKLREKRDDSSQFDIFQ